MGDSPQQMEYRILSTLKKEPQSVSELARKLGSRRDFLAGYLESMRERDMLRLVKIGKSNVYIPKEARR
jgi:predicted CopG family antitoxin